MMGGARRALGPRKLPFRRSTERAGIAGVIHYPVGFSKESVGLSKS